VSDALRFWALAEAVGLLSVPIARAFFARLPGGGLAFARPLGLLLAVYPAWLLASLHLLPYGDGTVLLGIALVAAVSIALWLLLGRRDKAARPLTSQVGAGERGRFRVGQLRWQLWLTGELIFTVCFFAWCLQRSFAPDVWNTEKPMDMAFVNAINRSQWFPPNDPWLSGATINYYYFGHYVVAVLIRLTHVLPSVGFNLGVSVMYALSAAAVFAVASALYTVARDKAGAPRVSPILPGLAATAFAMLLGNLAGALQFLTAPGPLATFDWWSPSRVIVNTITEFPFFSFLLADLHAHMMVVPFGMVALGFALQLAFGGPRLALGRAAAKDDGDGPSPPAPRPPSGRGAGGEGPPGADVATEAMLAPARQFNQLQPVAAADAAIERGRSATLVAVDSALAQAEEEQSSRSTVKELPTALPPVSRVGGHVAAKMPRLKVSWLAAAAELALASLVVGSLYAFNGWDYPTELGIGLFCLLLWATQDRSSRRLRAVAVWAVIWAAASFLLFLPFYLHFSAPTRGLGVVSDHSTLTQFLHDYLLMYGLPLWVVGAAIIWKVGQRQAPARYLVWGAVLALALLALLASWHVDGVILLLAALIFTLITAFESDQAQPYRVFWLLVAAAIGLVAIGEAVYIRDVFDHSVNYRMNTVFKFGYQAWFLFMILAGCGVFWSRRWLHPSVRSVWLAGLAILLACAAVYPVAATYAHDGAFQTSPTLDGLRWLEQRAPGDVAAIRWMQSHIQGSPTVLEAVGVQYDPAGHARVSTFTGLPTVVGWAGHEAEWAHDAGLRPQAVNTIYVTTDLDTARLLLSRLQVRYVFVGSLERADYPAAGLAKFAQLGTPVFSDQGTVVYELR